MIHLGKVKDPANQELKVNLENAQLAIDLLEMLQNKTRNNLSKDENDLLLNTLQQLRLEFIKASQEGKSSGNDKKES